MMHKKKGRGGGRGRQKKIAIDETRMWTEVLDKSQSKDSSHLLSISVGLLSLSVCPHLLFLPRNFTPTTKKRKLLCQPLTKPTKELILTFKTLDCYCFVVFAATRR